MVVVVLMVVLVVVVCVFIIVIMVMIFIFSIFVFMFMIFVLAVLVMVFMFHTLNDFFILYCVTKGFKHVDDFHILVGCLCQNVLNPLVGLTANIYEQIASCDF